MLRWTPAKMGRVWGPGWGVDGALEMRDLSKEAPGMGRPLQAAMESELALVLLGIRTRTRGWK